jgi:seryl-tRNA synthetase
LANTKTVLDKTTKDLTQTKQTLQATTEEKDKAVAEATKQSARAEQLATVLEATRKERDAAQAELAAFKVPGLTALQVANLSKTLKQLQDTLAGAQDENKLLGQNITKLKTKLAFYENPEFKVQLPASLKGKVIQSDPKWDFVVLDIGESQGILEKSELLVNRNGQLVAKVIVRSVQKDRCVANVVPGWKIGEVAEGDQVIPAYPAS